MATLSTPTLASGSVMIGKLLKVHQRSTPCNPITVSYAPTNVWLSPEGPLVRSKMYSFSHMTKHSY